MGEHVNSENKNKMREIMEKGLACTITFEIVEECKICYENYDNGDHKKMTLHVSNGIPHIVCLTCVKKIKSTKPTCPYCNADIPLTTVDKIRRGIKTFSGILKNCAILNVYVSYYWRQDLSFFSYLALLYLIRWAFRKFDSLI